MSLKMCRCRAPTAIFLISHAVNFLAPVQGVAIAQESNLPSCPNQNGLLHDCQGTGRNDFGVYIGEFRNNQPNGQGAFTTPEGDRSVGEWKNGKLNGKGTYISASDGSKYTGDFKDSKRSGQGTLTARDGTKYTGEFEDDTFNGVGRVTYSNGTIYFGAWKNGMQHGRGVFTEKDGRIRYSGDWKIGKRDGQGTLINEEDGTEYIGGFKDDKPNGQGTLYDAHGSVIVTGIFAGGHENGYSDMAQFSQSICGDIPEGSLTRTSIQGKIEANSGKLAKIISGDANVSGSRINEIYKGIPLDKLPDKIPTISMCKLELIKVILSVGFDGRAGH